MYSFEVMSITVQGFKEYALDGWNFVDQISYINFLIYFVIKVFLKNKNGFLQQSKQQFIHDDNKITYID